MARARASRYQQDSALASYRVIARQRGTGGIGLAAAAGLGPIGRTRLAARAESVARMYWHHRLGAFAEVIAARGIAPIDGETEPSYVIDEVMFALPYAPGVDRLWPMSEVREALPDAARWIVHPFEAGSDSLYRFSLGGPLSISLPSGRSVRLREVHVVPRRPDGSLVVGSFWIDVESGALVRAAYRTSIAMDLWPFIEPHVSDSDHEMVRRFGPFRGNVEEIVIEYGLYAERFWLPRARVAHAEGTAKGGRVTFSVEQTFTYEDVQALAPGEVQAPPTPPVSRRDWRDARDAYWDPQVNERGRRPCRDDDRAMREPLGADSIARLSGLRSHLIHGQRLYLLLPCDVPSLATSPELPASIFASGEELFTDTDLDQLRAEVKEAVAMQRQADWAPQPTQYRWGFTDGLARFNRVEALSMGIRAERELGEGLALDAELRLGVADLEPNGELRLTRTSGRRALRAGAFRRLAVANDWGNPHGLSASLGSLLWGNDLGLYYRTLGVELGGQHSRISGSSTFSWRAFSEQHRSAEVGHSFSFARVAAGSDFAENILALEGIYSGAEAALSAAWGLDPLGTQLSATARVEAADGPSSYGRAMIDGRLSRGIGSRTVVALTGGTGSSEGQLPPQRRFSIGGPWAVHAYHPIDVTNDAFWFARAEIARGFPMVRTTLFYDTGWTGSTGDIYLQRWNVRAGGVGLAALDGLFRVDLSRRIDGPPRWAFDLYFDLR